MLSHKKDFAGVLGWPLTHTLSPVIHNAAFREAGLDWVYLAFPVPPENLGAAIAGLRVLGCMGANVTMPHKRAVVAHLDEISGDATAIDAVNTIEPVAGKLAGRNTDVDGFRSFLESEVGFDATGRDAVVLGAGGAARAVVRALDAMDVATIRIVARDQGKARGTAAVVRSSTTEVMSFSDASLTDAIRDADVVVNATPVGMDGRADPLPEATFTGDHVVVDLIYEPPSTPLVERARASGADAWGGLGMLVRQAAMSFQIWTGLDPPIETMSAAAIHAIGRKNN